MKMVRYQGCVFPAYRSAVTSRIPCPQNHLLGTLQVEIMRPRYLSSTIKSICTVNSLGEKIPH